jgi:hypothetical protein
MAPPTFHGGLTKVPRVRRDPTTAKDGQKPPFVTPPAHSQDRPLGW